MRERGLRGAWSAAAGMAALGLLLVASGSAGTVLATPISNDPYTNSSSQHKTQVEPDSFAFGNTIVATFQTGRFINGGASNLAWSTSTDGGRTWTTGVLPGTTVYEGGPWARISDPAVAYDPEHDVWMISGLAIDASASGCGRPDQPFDRRRPHLAEPGHGRHGAGHLLRQELDRLRHVGVEPSLRQLLHAMGRRRRGLADPDEHVHRRRPHLGPPIQLPAQYDRPRRPAGRPAERDGDRAFSERAPSASSARRTAAPPGRPRPRCKRQLAPPPRGISGSISCPRPRSTATAGSTSSGTTAGSDRAAPRTTSS